MFFSQLVIRIFSMFTLDQKTTCFGISSRFHPSFSYFLPFFGCILDPVWVEPLMWFCHTMSSGSKCIMTLWSRLIVLYCSRFLPYCSSSAQLLLRTVCVQVSQFGQKNLVIFRNNRLIEFIHWIVSIRFIRSPVCLLRLVRLVCPSSR